MATIFSLYIKHGNNTTLKNPNYKRRFHNGLNGPKKISRDYQPKPPLYRLSLNKSPIKNHAILFGSGRVIKTNQAKLGSTKPNSLVLPQPTGPCFLRAFSCTIVSPYFIVKSLQLRGRKQIAEPRKYCLVRVIVFL